jgi:hypothetical protein
MRVSFSLLEMPVPGVDHWTGPDGTGTEESSCESWGAASDRSWHEIRRPGPEGVYVQYAAACGVGS